MTETTPCTVDGCEKVKQRGRSMCAMHVARRARHGSTDPTPLTHGTPAERFLRHVAQGSSDECWLWTGAKNNNGYGQMTVEGKCVYAHRWS